MRKNNPQNHTEKFHFQSETLIDEAKLAASLDTATYIVFDIESTGGNPEKNGITEISALKYFQGKVQDTFYSLVNPRVPIPPIVQRMTGITNQMVRKAPYIEKIYASFLDFIGNDILISHNTVGDLIFLTYFARKTCHHKLSNFFLCTHLLAEKTIRSSTNYSLTGLGAHLNLEVPGKSHRAEADAQLTLLLFQEIKKRLEDRGILTVRDAIRFQGHLESAIRLGLALDAPSFNRAPENCGVFSLLDIDNRSLFASSSINLRRDLMSLRQFDGVPRRLLRLVLQSYSYHVHNIPNIFAAMLKEAELQSDTPGAFEAARWHGRSVSLLYFLQETEEEGGGFTIGVGEFPFSSAHVRYAFGPIKDFKETQEKCKALANLLSGVWEKKTLKFSPEKNRLIGAICEKTLTHQLTALRKERFKLRNLFSISKQQKISAKIRTLKALSQLDILQDFTLLSSLKGVLSVPHEKGKRELYPIYESYPLKPIVVSKEEDNDKIREEFFAKSVRKLHPKQNLSELDVLKVNAVLWVVTVGTKKKQFDCYFYPSEKN